jgi:hypothetical protein
LWAGKKHQFTQRIQTRASRKKKVAPPVAITPKAEPLNFLYLNDLVINLKFVETEKIRKQGGRRKKPLYIGHSTSPHDFLYFVDSLLIPSSTF